MTTADKKPGDAFYAFADALPSPPTMLLVTQPADPIDAGVISDMERPVVLSTVDADRVAALIEERPGPTEAMRALFAERRPCAGWVEYRPDRWRLSAGPMFEAQIDRGVGTGRYVWRVADGHGGIGVDRWVDSLDAAMISAEDALRAIAAEILRAVGP